MGPLFFDSEYWIVRTLIWGHHSSRVYLEPHSVTQYQPCPYKVTDESETTPFYFLYTLKTTRLFVFFFFAMIFYFFFHISSSQGTTYVPICLYFLDFSCILLLYLLYGISKKQNIYFMSSYIYRSNP